MRHFIRVCFATLLLVGTAATAAAQGRGPGGQGGVGLAAWGAFNSAFDSVAAQLELTDDQLFELGALVLDIQEQHGPALEQWTKMREEMRQLWSSGERPSREQMQEIAAKYGNPEQELRPVMQTFQETLGEILTDPQQEKLQELMRQRVGRRRPA